MEILAAKAVNLVGGDGLVRGSLAEGGLDPAHIEGFLADAAAAGLELHSLMVYHNGLVGFEIFKWPYGAGKRRVMHSVAKSFTSTAIGFAVAEGDLRLDDTVISFFPDDLPAHVAPHLAAMTVENLLTMQSGHAGEVSGAFWRGVNSSWIREFFSIPVVHAPGTTHVYSSAVSYMLAAILYKTTGQTLHDYLKPRLLEPLGFKDETWDIGTDGFNPGGNGLTCTVPELLKLGILYANDGMWDGKRLLPEHWAARATRQHVERYGFHWVVYDNGAYAALGQFVQLAMVFPEHKAVLALTGAIDGSALALPHIFSHFPAAFERPELSSKAAEKRLSAMVKAWALPAPLSQRPFDCLPAGRTLYAIAPNPLGVKQIAFERDADQLSLFLTNEEGTFLIRNGINRWLHGVSTMPGRELHHGYRLMGTSVVAAAEAIDPQTLKMTWCFDETAFRDTVVCAFDGEQVTIDRSVNMNSADRRWPTLVGRRQS